MFQADPARFQTDQSRIVFAASFLRGPARDWWAPNIDPRTGAMKFQTYSEFLEALSNAFDDPDSRLRPLGTFAASAKRTYLVLTITPNS